ncbi:MAG TPA: haloacid dehalogenase-like hydrolase [Clostridiales bacterium]|nr:haloacid dehalogenase-like hydrolase [Clostridiales bacterium]
MEVKGCPIMALCYDFDKTLSPKDMQEYGFIDSLGMTSQEFWHKSNTLVREQNMDMILAYMLTMTTEAKRQDIDVTEEDLRKLGKGIELYKGVKSWFDRINKIGLDNGVVIEHYIISSGLKEIIEGNEIAPYFKKIYASCFLYDQYGKAVWPKQAVNFTTKTQYLFHINKNCDTEDVNRYMPEDKRRIPFEHFIYIGDSETDIPCMRLVKSSGGHSIGVYKPDDDKAKTMVEKLIREGRINYYAPSDFSSCSEIENIVSKIIVQIKAKHDLLLLSKNQMQKAKKSLN